jgi:ubiquinone/menaquinone biosynthesis C-methylase UbiE
MITQTQNNKMGEIEFRKKLARQQVEGIISLDDEFSSDEIEMILGDRMRATFEQMTLHKDRDIVLSPYIEIGAERGQRSLVMESDLGAEGAAIDISYDMLKSCDYYSKKFDKAKTPLRICCDAYNLPFLSNSIPFVFCYETLHHFPHPGPVIKEIFRVLLPGGYFFFAEEPFKGVARLELFESKHRNYSKQARDRGTVRKTIEFFLYKSRCNEIEHDIIENDAITIGMWKEDVPGVVEG